MLSGVGSVLVFLPQILTLFFFILLLEDFGYMARAAFLMDRIMGGAGLHGRAFIPLLSSFACAIPGIMATRVISSRRGRLATILVAPLMTCSARIPVYTLIIAAFIPARTVFGWLSLQGVVMFGLYTAGIASALGMSWVFNRFLWRRESSEPFMLELPDYKRPVLRNIALGLVQRGQIFLKRAGTTIFAMMVVIWCLCSVPPAPPDAAEPAINYSLAARIGQVMEPVLRPVGFNWQIDVALVPGMAAREVAVAALGTVYSIAGADENPGELGRVLTAHWSLGTALAFAVWQALGGRPVVQPRPVADGTADAGTQPEAVPVPVPAAPARSPEPKPPESNPTRSEPPESNPPGSNAESHGTQRAESHAGRLENQAHADEQQQFVRTARRRHAFQSPAHPAARPGLARSAFTRLAVWSFTGPTRKTMRSRSRRE